MLFDDAELASLDVPERTERFLGAIRDRRALAAASHNDFRARMAYPVPARAALRGAGGAGAWGVTSCQVEYTRVAIDYP